MAEIFLSYSRLDRDTAQDIAQLLQAEGYSVWWDSALVAGEAWDETIRGELRCAHCVVVLWSKASWSSRWVHAEATAGHERGILVAARLDDIALEPPFNIVQTADVRTPAGIDDLVQGVRQVLRAPRDVREPLRPTARASASHKWLIAVPAGVVALLVLAVGTWLLWPNAPHKETTAASTQMASMPESAPTSMATTSPAGELSLAVLPFENLSSDPQNAYFAAGVQDEILTQLTKIGALKVISRTSTAQFANKPDDLKRIAEQLGVAYIVEGSVRRDRNDVRITVQLINAATDAHVWAESYDRELSRVLLVQSEIATAIAAALNANITGREQQELSQAPTRNAEAYDAYLHALAVWREQMYGDAASASAEKSLERATALDPNFVNAWALLAQMRANGYVQLGGATEQRRAAAQAAVETAVRLGADQAAVQLARGFYRYWVEGDFEGARRQFESLNVLWPNNVEILSALGYLARRQGRWEESKNYFTRAKVLDPRSRATWTDEVDAHYHSRDFDGALRLASQALEIWPVDRQLSLLSASILLTRGAIEESWQLVARLRPEPDDGYAWVVFMNAAYRREYAGAIAILMDLLARDHIAGSPGMASANLNSLLGELLELSGDRAGARKRFQASLEEQLAQLGGTPTGAQGDTLLLGSLAFTYSALGDRYTALEHIDRAIELSRRAGDEYNVLRHQLSRARILARHGDRDRAIREIARLAKLPAPDPLTPAVLRLDPDFDKLRGDPRFEALLAEASAL